MLAITGIFTSASALALKDAASELVVVTNARAQWMADECARLGYRLEFTNFTGTAKFTFVLPTNMVAVDQQLASEL